MESRIFVDSSAWYALVDEDDANHKAARDLLMQALADYRLVTSNHIIGESYTLLRSRLGYDIAVEFLHRVRRSLRVERVFVTQSWEEEAYSLLERYHDQDFSFVDATSFVVMKALDIPKAFAFDKHFTTAGFVVLE